MLVQNDTHLAAASVAGKKVFLFGPFTLDANRGALTWNGAEIPLRPKAFEVLSYLLLHAGRLVSREELLETIWSGVVVTDDSLTQCLVEIRKALGDEERKVVRTVPRRGYQFGLPVTVSAAAVGDHGKPVNRRWRQPSLWSLAALAMLAVAIGVTWWRVGFQPAHEAGQQAVVHPAEDVWIAVLPFVDLSEEGDQEYLGNGISDEILNLLARVPGLTVIARTSSFSFKDQGLDIRAIAQRLNVTHILEGSVSKSGDEVRVTAQLVDGSNGVAIWSQSYDGRLDDVIAMQSRISRAVTGALSSRLQVGDPSQTALVEAELGTQPPEAWNLYLRGKYFYGRRAEGDILRAQRYFERALAIDQDLAEAWIRLAGTLYLRWVENGLPEGVRLSGAEALPLIQYSVERTLELDPHHPEALMRLAALSWRAGNTGRFSTLMYQAMKYGRNNALVQSMLAGLAFWISDPVTMIELQRRAVRLDPISFNQIQNLAFYLYWSGHLDESADAFRQASEINPELRSEQTEILAWISIHQKKYAAAESLVQSLPAGPARDAAWSMLQYQAGNEQAASAALASLLQNDDWDSRVRAAFVQGFQGNIDAAFRSLDVITETMLAEPDEQEARWLYLELRSSPFLQALHADGRWKEWLNRTEELFHHPSDAEIAESLQRYAAVGSPGRF